MGDLASGLQLLSQRDQATLADPFTVWSELRDQEDAAVFDVGLGGWIVSRHDLVREILRDTDRWSNSNAPSGGRRNGPFLEAMAQLSADPTMAAPLQEFAERSATSVLLTADPPEHVRQRRALNAAFRPSRIRAKAPLIDSVANRLIDELTAAPSVEFVHDFAVPLPMEIIARELGVPVDDLALFKGWSDDLSIPLGNAEPTVDEVRSFILSAVAFRSYFSERLLERRDNPTSDLLTDVAKAAVDGVPLSHEEQLACCQQFLVAGNETTTKLLANIAYRLAIDEALQARVRTNPDLVETLVEEVLRYEAPVQGLYRRAKTDIDFHGVQIAAGDSVWLVFSSANRDPATYDCPHELDIDRADVGHLSFGHGEHFCIGAGLARLEASVAIRRLLERLPSFALETGFTPTYENSFLLRGLRSLPLVFAASRHK